MRASLMRSSSRRSRISCQSLSISAFSRMRALMLFAATLRAWVRDDVRQGDRVDYRGADATGPALRERDLRERRFGVHLPFPGGLPRIYDAGPG